MGVLRFLDTLTATKGLPCLQLSNLYTIVGKHFHSLWAPKILLAFDVVTQPLSIQRGSNCYNPKLRC